MRVQDVLVWSVPLAIAGVAAVLGVRAYLHPPAPPPPSAPAPPPCPPDVYRCRESSLEVTTGELGVDGKSCMQRKLRPCRRACTTTRAVLAATDEGTAHAQLCDPPKHVERLVSEQTSYLAQPLVDAGTCEGDGFVPTDDGILQCVARNGKDPSAPGVVFGRLKCRFGAIATSDRSPRLIPRNEAIALWCRRDPHAPFDDDEEDAGPLDAAVDAHAASDAVAGASDAH